MIRTRPILLMLLAISGLMAGAGGLQRVLPSSTQPAGEMLLDHAGLLQAARQLERSGRVTVEIIGTSAGGRAIPMLIITEPGVPVDRLQARSRARTSLQVRHETLQHATVAPALDAAGETRLPLLLAGASWGHEAAHVEGLMAAAEHLATDESDRTRSLLRQVVVLIVPVMNPDGRERSITEWRHTPLSLGEDGVGNEHGVMINRDFIHQTQPESRAILAVTRAWNPVLGIDLHEDMNRLGLAIPDVAFVPPFMSGMDVEEHPLTRGAIVATGGAIAARWRAAGYEVAYDPAGERRWVPMPSPDSGEINPMAGSSGRLDFLWTIHGIPGLITESARTPGTQSWHARVAQKKLAVLAAADAVASAPEFYVRSVLDRRREAVEAGGREFLAIPDDQPIGADRRELRRLLLAHGVRVYRAAEAPYDLVPLGQPAAPLVRHALLAERSKLNDLPAALGVRILRSSDLPSAERERLLERQLEPLVEAGQPWPQTGGRRGTVAVYRGQGLDRTAWGELEFVLGWMGFSTVALDQDDIRAGRWKQARAVVFGDGPAEEIVEGWSPSRAGRQPPWQVTLKARGIGAEGLDQISRFVRDGGRLVTIGQSAGLALHPATRLVNAIVVDGLAGRPGIGQVRLRVTQAGRPLFTGVPAPDGVPRAFLYAPPGATAAGYLFAVPNPDHVASYYDGALSFEPEQSFAATAALTLEAGHAAIVSASAGRGHVVLFGIAPTFRAQWRSTFHLLAASLEGPADDHERR
jgi:hypothetical protein